MHNKVSIANDITWQVTNSAMHQYFGPMPPSPTPVLLPLGGMALESPVPMYWPPGFTFLQNRLTTTVVHKSLPIVQDGHNCGVLIPHLQIVPGPLNVLTPLVHVLFSSRKTNFCSSTVVVNGRCTAAATLVSLPPTPMTSCWDPVSPPLSDSPTSHTNSLIFGMTWADIIIGWAAIGAMMLLEYALFKWSPAPAPASSCGEAVSRAVVNKIVPTSSEALGQWVLKQSIAASTGVARYYMTDGPLDTRLLIGAPFANLSLKFSRDVDGRSSMTVGTRAYHHSGEIKADRTGVTATHDVRSYNTSDKTTHSFGSEPTTEHVVLADTSYRGWGEPL